MTHEQIRAVVAEVQAFNHTPAEHRLIAAIEQLLGEVEVRDERIHVLENLLRNLRHRLDRGTVQADVRADTCKYLVEWIDEVIPRG